MSKVSPKTELLQSVYLANTGAICMLIDVLPPKYRQALVMTLIDLYIHDAKKKTNDR